MTAAAVVVCSGGLDSVTAAYAARADLGYEHLVLVAVDYGQRHRKELHCARAAAEALGAQYRHVDLTGLAVALSGSALTDPTVDVPDGHYAEDTMRATVVPNRNAILLSVAVGIAVAEGANAVVLGVHGGDHYIYPDCRPGFLTAIEAAMVEATDGFAVPGFRIVAPFLRGTKVDVAAAAGRLGVPIAETWSCYRGGEIHCGRCGTCVERREALHFAGVDDPTEYDDPDYWRTVIL
jgi:7-cyano-7-deazaguanine synthase